MLRREPDENIWWIFAEKEEESDTDDSEEWQFSESESADLGGTGNSIHLSGCSKLSQRKLRLL